MLEFYQSEQITVSGELVPKPWPPVSIGDYREIITSLRNPASGKCQAQLICTQQIPRGLHMQI